MSELTVPANTGGPGPPRSGGAPGRNEDEGFLLVRAAGGDLPAFRSLVDRHLPALLALARRMLGDGAEAEDVAQEAMLRLWREASRIEVQAAGLRPWLRRVAVNLCMDRLRAGKRLLIQDDLPEIAEAPSQSRGLEAAERSERVARALNELPERQRLALALFHFEELSQAEVGGVMGISDDAVESLLARGRRALREILKDEWRGLIANDD